MSKALRNTLFTVAALALTALGLGWNKETAVNQRPLSAERAVLAGTNLEGAEALAFPLEVQFNRETMRLGQTQEMVIATVPEAQLDIVTQYPNGSINNPQTLKAQADADGKYRLSFKLSDFHFLGLFQTTVVATSGNKTTQTTGRFVLQTWATTTQVVPSSDYVYPLVP